MENFLRCRALAKAIHEGFPGFMGCGRACISLVPAHGPFDPAKSYGDAAFGIGPTDVIRLEPLTFGLSIIVPHAEDSGSLWLRTSIRIEMIGSHFDVFVAPQPRLRVPLEYLGLLEPVFEAVSREYLRLFEVDLAHFNDERFADGIGFLPRPVPE